MTDSNLFDTSCYGKDFGWDYPPGVSDKDFEEPEEEDGEEYEPDNDELEEVRSDHYAT